MVTPHKSNPGGSLDPSQIIGRDKLIAFIWETLERQSVWMTAERRIGKTQIMNKMKDEPKPGWNLTYYDLEGVKTAQEFAKQVWGGIRTHLNILKRTARRAQAVWDAIQEVEVKGIKIDKATGPRPWKDLLEAAVEDLESEKGSVRLLFFFDELTYMIQRIAGTEGEATAMEVLDVLRQLRQTHPSFRMVVSGSIGLHQVLTSLREAGHQNPVMNDLYAIEIPPIDESDARNLALSLIEGHNLTASNQAASAMRIAEHACNWPFYVHSIVKQIAYKLAQAEVADVDWTVGELLVDAHDPLQMGHFRNRLTSYYPGRDKAAAAVLDALALATDPLTTDELLREVQATGQQIDRKGLLDLLRAMKADHYLAHGADGRYRLALPLFARWWKLDRGL